MATQTLLLALALTLSSSPLLGAVAQPAPQGAAAAPAEPANPQEEPMVGPADGELTFDQIFARPAAHAFPKQFAWSPDGDHLAYLMPGDDDQDVLWALNVGTLERSMLLDSAELPSAAVEPGDSTPREDDGEDESGAAPDARSIDGYEFLPSGGLLVQSGDDIFRVEPGKTPQRLLGKSVDDAKAKAEAQAAPQDPHLSPDGQHLAYVRAEDLYVMDLASGKERALTTDGVDNEVLNGQTDWVYWEEIHGRTSKGFWWSPDSQKIAYYRFDDRTVPIYTLLDFSGQYPEPRSQRYPKAGTTNPTVQVGVLDLRKKGGKTVWLDTTPEGAEPGSREADVYLARVHWLPDGEHVAVQRLNRDQNRLDLLRCSATDGSCTTLITETNDTWINLGDELNFLKDGRFLWSSEDSGWKHLYLYAADGTLIRQLTQGRWSVTSVDFVDEEANRVIFTAPASPSAGYVHREVYAANLDATMQVENLTQSAGWHTALVAPGAKHWLHTVSTADLPPIRELKDATGQVLTELIAKPAPTFDAAALPQWELQFIWGLDGIRLPARLLRPANLEPGKKYPVIMYHYGGPGSQMVVNRWGGARDLWHKMMAQRGYVILIVDSISSAFYGKTGEDKDHRLFGPSNLAAQDAGIEFLKSLQFPDLDRVGIWGWSGGGSSTLSVLLNRPGVWKAGVAGAPVTDWTLYDTIWTERYLDHPDDNPEGYKNSSPIHKAAELKDHLLLVHGTGDDNVHPQNSMAMSTALIKANIPFEQAIYPNQKHGFRGPSSRHFYEKMTAFFDRYLGGPEDG